MKVRITIKVEREFCTTLRIGSRVKIAKSEYILASVTTGVKLECVLINISTGEIWANIVQVNNLYDISIFEFIRLLNITNSESIANTSPIQLMDRIGEWVTIDPLIPRT